MDGLNTQMMNNLQRAFAFMGRNPHISVGLQHTVPVVYEARMDGRLIGGAADLGVLMDLLEQAERLDGGAR